MDLFADAGAFSSDPFNSIAVFADPFQSYWGLNLYLNFNLIVIQNDQGVITGSNDQRVMTRQY